MKKYLLLRNNLESGPYSVEQLASIGLLPLDLIWIEDESTGWKYPEEIEALASLIQYNSTSSPQENNSSNNKKISVLLPSGPDQKSKTDHAYSSLPFTETNFFSDEANAIKTIEEINETDKLSEEKKPIWKKRFSPTITAGVIATCIGVMIGAFVIKEFVDDYVSETTQETAATPILDREPTPVANENFQNALVTEIVPVYKNTTLKKAKHTDIKKHLNIKANEYKVGLFGGINGLQLTVFNTSDQMADKVIVAVDYLKPNGSVVQSENVLFSSIKPKEAQTIGIPASKRGVKIKYKILKVFSHNYKADLKEV